MYGGAILDSIRRFLNGRFSAGNTYPSPLEVQKAEWSFYINYLQEGMTVFDVGANIGELTMLFSKFVGRQGQVHAFEPSNATFEHLELVCSTAMRYRSYRNIVLNQLALTEKEGEMSLYVYDDEHSGWNTLAKRPLKEKGIEVEVIDTERIQTTTIDLYCQRNCIESIDLLKVDVEGPEYQVLLGARSMLESKSIRCCVFEFGATTFDMGNTPGEIEQYLKQFGYKIQNIIKGDPIFPGGSGAKSARFSMHVARPL
jgi:FkbM family methyltransferase